jgi:hypothetical protein
MRVIGGYPPSESIIFGKADIFPAKDAGKAALALAIIAKKSENPSCRF